MRLFRYKEIAIAYKKIFNTYHGKLVLEDLVKSNFVLSPTISKDPHMTSFKEGQRNVVLKILQLLEADLTKIEEMIKQSSDSEDLITKE